MATQSQIDDLLNDSSDQQTSKKIDNSNVTVKNQAKQKDNKKQQKYTSNYEQSYSYANQNFQDYQQSRRTQNFQASQSQSLTNKQNSKKIDSKQKGKGKNISQQLTVIKQQQQKKPNNKPQRQIKPALQLKTQSAFYKKNTKSSKKIYSPDKQHLPHNYARLEQRQKQLLLTTLSEQNKKLKSQLAQKQESFKKIQIKYKMALTEKAQQTSTAKEIALEKQVISLRTKLQQMANLQKITQERQKYKTKMNKNPGSFIPQQQSNRRQAELLELIDKLKRRLLESDESMSVLQKKLNQGVQHNQQLHRKMKRVQQLQYKIQKMTEQAETDRGYIDILKDKVKQLEKQIDSEKNRNRKMQIEMKRMEMGQITHADILKQLSEVKKQKQLLQKSLKQMSSAIMTNVRKNYQNNSGNSLQDSGQLLSVKKK